MNIQRCFVLHSFSMVWVPLLFVAIQTAHAVAEPLPRLVYARKFEVGDQLAVAANYSLTTTSFAENWGKSSIPLEAGVRLSVLISGTLSISGVTESGQCSAGSLELVQLSWDGSGSLADGTHVDPLSADQHKLWGEPGRRLQFICRESAVIIEENNLVLTDSQKSLFSRLLSDMTQGISARRYGSKRPEHIGDTWPVNVSDRFARQLVPNLKETKFNLSLTEGSGVQLIELSDCSGVECFELLATTEGKVHWKPKEVDDQMALLGVAMTAKESFRFLLPVAPDSLFKRCRRVREWKVQYRSDNEETRCIRREQRIAERLETFVTEVEQHEEQATDEHSSQED